MWAIVVDDAGNASLPRDTSETATADTTED